MVRLKKTVIAVGAALAVALAVAGVVMHFLDPRAVATSLAASVEADTGRALSFGNTRFKLFPRPALVVSDLRFANAAWGAQPWMATVERLQADIGILPLLSGEVRIKRVTVSAATVNLETDAEGNGNWVLGSTGGAPPPWLSRLQVDSLKLQPCALNYRDGRSGEERHFALDLATLTAPAGGELRFQILGRYGGAPAEIKGTAGGIVALLANGAAYPVSVEATLAAASLTLRGTVDRPLDLGALHFEFGATGSEVSDLGALAARKLPPLGAFKAVAKLDGTLAALAVSGVAVDVGAPERVAISARGDIKLAVSRERLDWSTVGLDVSARGAQLHDLGELAGRPLPALGRFLIAARVTGSLAAPGLKNIELDVGSPERVAVTAHGEVADVRGATGIDLHVAAEAKNQWRLGAADGSVRMPPFHLRTRLRDVPNGYAAQGLELQVAGSTVNASLSVATGGARPRVTARISSPSIDLARLTAPAEDLASSAAQSSDGWRLADVDLDLQLGKLVLSDGRQLQAISGRLSLADGRLRATQLKAALGGARWQLDGSMREPAHLGGLDVNVSVQGNELAEQLRFFGAKLPAVGPYKGTGRATGSMQTLALDKLDVAAGKTGQRLRATGSIRDTLNWQGLDLGLTVTLSDTAAFGRLFGADLPRLPQVRATARLTGPAGGYVLDDLALALPRTNVRGRVTIDTSGPRMRVNANLGGPLLDMNELPNAPGKPSPLEKVDVVADLRFDRVVLADRRALTPVSGQVELAAGAAVLRKFTIGVQGASATLDGKIADALRQTGIDVAVNAEIKHVNGLEAFTGLDLPDVAPLAVSGQVSDTPGGYAVANLKATSGESELRGDVTVTRGRIRHKVVMNLVSPLLDADAFVKDTPGAAGARDGRLIPDTPLPLDLLKAIDADVNVRIDRLRLFGGEPVGPVTVQATIADGRLRADPVRIGITADEFYAFSGTVDTAKSRTPLWNFTLKGGAINLGNVVGRMGRPGLITGGMTDFTLEGSASGSTMRAVAGSLTGRIRMSTGSAVVRQSTGALGSGLLFGLAESINPFRRTDPETQVSCVGINVPIRDGTLTSDRQVAIETAKFNVVMSGTINLRTEAVDLGFTPVLARGISLTSGRLTQLVRVRGTLAAPQIVTDVAGATRGALSLGAAYMTFGGSLLVESLLNRSSNDPHPCATALGG